MGRNLLLDMTDHGFSVAGYDKDAAKVDTLRQESKKVLFRVAESLIDFQRKVAQVGKALCLALDNFDLVVHLVEFAGVDGVITVV